VKKKCSSCDKTRPLYFFGKKSCGDYKDTCKPCERRRSIIQKRKRGCCR